VRAILATLMLVSLARPADAEFDKLSPSARIALARLRTGALPEKLQRDGIAVTRGRARRVHCVGTAGRAELGPRARGIFVLPTCAPQRFRLGDRASRRCRA
jgi:hypothetical protein